MKSFRILMLLAATFAISLSACKKDDDDPIPPVENPPEDGNMEISATGLSNLGSDYAYEGWIVVDGSPMSTGVFTVNDQGELSQSSFEVNDDDLANATEFILTIEPSPDTDPDPSSVKLLAGDFSGNTATLDVGDDSAIGTDFTGMSGSYILITPTDNNDDSNEKSGVWWFNSGILPTASLDLPALPIGWTYEGWAVIDGTPVSTGKFSSASEEDNADTYSGSTEGPNFPGEDFLMNSPSGLVFPTNLEDNMIVVSVEPEPDNSAAPFVLKPLIATVPLPAEVDNSYDMANNATASNPTAEVMR